MSVRHISTGSPFEAQIGYSRAVVADGWVFVAGTTGYDYASMTIAEDVVSQAEQCMHNIAEALEEAGSSLDEVVRVHYIFPDREDFEPCWPVFRRFLGSARPAATMFVAGLLDDRMRLEVEVTARVAAG